MTLVAYQKLCSPMKSSVSPSASSVNTSVFADKLSRIFTWKKRNPGAHWRVSWLYFGEVRRKVACACVC